MVGVKNNWQNWEFAELINALKEWTERNPSNVDQQRKSPKKDRLFQARQGQQLKKEHVCCGSEIHGVFDCEKVKDIFERRKICYNCLKEGYIAISCKSKKIM